MFAISHLLNLCNTGPFHCPLLLRAPYPESRYSPDKIENRKQLQLTNRRSVRHSKYSCEIMMRTDWQHPQRNLRFEHSGRLCLRFVTSVIIGKKYERVKIEIEIVTSIQKACEN